jgi:hypothetical protein
MDPIKKGAQLLQWLLQIHNTADLIHLIKVSLNKLKQSICNTCWHQWKETVKNSLEPMRWNTLWILYESEAKGFKVCTLMKLRSLFCHANKPLVPCAHPVFFFLLPCVVSHFPFPTESSTQQMQILLQWGFPRIKPIQWKKYSNNTNGSEMQRAIHNFQGLCCHLVNN